MAFRTSPAGRPGYNLRGGLMPGIQRRFGAGLGDMLMGAGAGLMGQGPSLTPQSPWQGLGAGLMMGQQMAAQRRKRAQEDERMEMERAKWETEQRQAAAAARAPRFQNVPGVGLVQLNAEGGPSVSIAAQEKDPLAKLRAYAESSPEEQAALAAASKAMGAPPVALNLNTLKPVGADAPKYVMPDGSTPPIDATPADIAAAGGRAISPEEDVSRREGAKNATIIAALDSEVANANTAYETARTAFEAEQNPKTKRELDEAANYLSRARAGRANWRGEPSGDVARDFRQPGAFRAMAERNLNSVLEWMRSGDEAQTQALPAEPDVAAPQALPGAEAGAPPDGFSADEWAEYQALERRFSAGQ